MKLVFQFYQKTPLTLGQNELQPVGGTGTAAGNGLLGRLHRLFRYVYRKTTDLLEHPAREAVISKQEVTSSQSYITRHILFFCQWNKV